MYRSKKMVRTTLPNSRNAWQRRFFRLSWPSLREPYRGLQLSDTNGERYLHQIRSVCLQQGPIDGIFQQDIDMLVDSLFA